MVRKNQKRKVLLGFLVLIVGAPFYLRQGISLSKTDFDKTLSIMEVMGKTNGTRQYLARTTDENKLTNKILEVVNDLISNAENNRHNFGNPSETYNEIPKSHVTHIDCAKLFNNDQKEMEKARDYHNKNIKVPIPDEEYLKQTRNCDTFKRERQYTLKPLSQEEANFPIAYSLLVYKNVEQIERLLRAIYRPQNYYCIHVDAKARSTVIKTLRAIANCFDNMSLSSKSIDIKWGHFSVLEAEFVCMEDLIEYKKWKYFINLTGQEWPLKTNSDIVKILKVFNGTNSIEGTIKRQDVRRTRYIYKGPRRRTKVKKGPPPKGITITKGSVHIAVSRAYIEFVLNNPVAKEFKQWVMDTGIPDETYFSSLNHSPNLGIPGAYKGDPETDPIKYPFIARFKNWGGTVFNWPCKGKRVRQICIWGIGDLPLLKVRPELFTNKFHLKYEPLALDCMEELHYNNTRNEVAGDQHFNTAYYQGLEFVTNHV